MSNRPSSTAYSSHERVLRKAKHQCWSCSNACVDELVSVINWKPDRSQDTAIDLLEQRGMINFRLSSTSNAIVLCPNCTHRYKNGFDPGIMIVPTDLEYFILFEKHNFDKRYQRLRDTGCMMMRTCPTNQMYRDHQVLQGLISPGEPGGLYRVIVLRQMYDFDHPVKRALKDWPDYPYDTEPKVWHGAPMANIRHAFIGLSSLRIHKIPPDVLDSLRQLQCLYSQEPDFVKTSGSFPKVLTLLSYGEIKNRYAEEHHENRKKLRREEDDSEISLPGSKRICLIEDYQTQAVIDWLLLLPPNRTISVKNSHRPP